MQNPPANSRRHKEREIMMRVLSSKLYIILFLVAIFLTASTGAAFPAPAEAAGVPLTANEQQMAKLINQARSEAGLSPLVVDSTLSGLARIKAQDMASNGYLSHKSPTYGSLNDMLKAAGVSCAAENLAKAPRYLRRLTLCSFPAPGQYAQR